MSAGTLLPLLHPLLGALAVCAVFFVGLRGLRSRRPRPDAAASRAFHRRYAPAALGLVGLSWLGGISSVALLREDLDPAGSWHFVVASTVLTVMVGLWLRSPERTGHAPRAVAQHVAAGFFTMLAAILTATLGLGLLP